MKVQPIRSCSCKAGRHTTHRSLNRKIRSTKRARNQFSDPDDAQNKSHPVIAGGYTD